MRLIAPQFVKPFVKSNKNDVAGAEAICEVAQRPTMRFVAVKTVEQQDIQAIHRMRSLVVDRRTAQINQIRGLLPEYGMDVTQGRARRCGVSGPAGGDAAGETLRYRRSGNGRGARRATDCGAPAGVARIDRGRT